LRWAAAVEVAVILLPGRRYPELNLASVPGVAINAYSASIIANCAKYKLRQIRQSTHILHPVVSFWQTRIL